MLQAYFWLFFQLQLPTYVVIISVLFIFELDIEGSL